MRKVAKAIAEDALGEGNYGEIGRKTFQDAAKAAIACIADGGIDGEIIDNVTDAIDRWMPIGYPASPEMANEAIRAYLAA